MCLHVLINTLVLCSVYIFCSITLVSSFSLPVTVKQPQVFVDSGKADNFTLVLIGGAPNMMTSLTGLQGCVRGFMIGKEPLALKPLATRTMKGK